MDTDNSPEVGHIEDGVTFPPGDMLNWTTVLFTGLPDRSMSLKTGYRLSAEVTMAVCGYPPIRERY